MPILFLWAREDFSDFGKGMTYQGSGEPKEPVLNHFDNFQALKGNLEATNSQPSSFLIMRISRRPTTREFLNSHTCVSVFWKLHVGFAIVKMPNLCWHIRC